MIGSNLVVEGVPGNHHHHHPHHHHHALATAGGSHPLHTFSAIHHHLNQSPSSRAHLMSATTFAEPFLKTANGAVVGGGGGGASLLQPSPPEFAHPLPKPAPIVPRYNGVTSSSLNGGAKPTPPSRLSSKYTAESDSPHVPVNLVQSKEPLPPPSSSPQSSIGVDVVGGHPAYALYTSGSRIYQPNPTYPPRFAPPPPPQPPSSLSAGPYGPLYPPNPFTTMLHRSGGGGGGGGGAGAENHRSTSHLLALQQQYPEVSTAPPHLLKSPPAPTGLNGVVKTIYEPPVVPIVMSETAAGAATGGRSEKRFKVPSGKEGSLKHRILTRPEAPRGSPKKSSSSSTCSSSTRAGHTTNALLPPPSSSPTSSSSTTSSSSFSSSSCSFAVSASSCSASMTSSNLTTKNGSMAVTSPTDSASASIVTNAHHISNSTNNCNSNSSSGGTCATGTVLPKFIKGSLIQLANGSVKKVEDMQTEDFISCVENSTTMRIDPSTVVRIQESAHRKGMTTVTLSYGEQRNQVDVESSVEHPYFVVKRGWSSYAPNKTLQIYRLSCHQLQVGDVCLTLSPKVTPNASRKSNAVVGSGGGVPGSGGNNGGGGGSSSGSSSNASQRRPNGHSGVAAVASSNVVESSKATASKKNDLKIHSAADNDKDECRHSSNSTSNSGSSSSSNNNNDNNNHTCSSSSNSNNNYNGSNSSNSHGSSANSGGGGSSIHHQLHQLGNAVDGSVSGKFSRMALVNGHEEAKKFEGKAAVAAENDSNNNSNSTGDKYEPPSAKKKRRWSAPDQIPDEYQPPSLSPLASPPVLAVSGVATAMSKNNV